MEVSETVRNSDDDESLLDPAIGTYNYFAPGADRYKIELILSKRSLTEAVSSDNFIELLRVANGSIIVSDLRIIGKEIDEIITKSV